MSSAIDFLTCKQKMINCFKSLFFVLLILTVSCNTSEKRHIIQGKAQGTTFTLAYYSKEEVKDLDKSIFSILESIDLGLSTYRPDSYISKWNKGETLDTMDTYFKEMYLLSDNIYKLTDGYFDPTVQPLSQFYGFEKKESVLPEEIDSILNFVGFDKLTFNGKGVERMHPEVKLNYNAIAQGYTVDVIVDHLYTKNIKNFIFELGGEVFCSGMKPEHVKWVIGVDRPKEDRDGTFQSEVSLTNLAITTSGNYRKWKEDSENGKKYTHTINPHTGESSASDLLSVTVIDKSCAKADALSTALLSMKYEKTKTFLEKQNIPVMLILEKEGNTVIEYFNGFDKFIN